MKKISARTIKIVTILMGIISIIFLVLSFVIYLRYDVGLNPQSPYQKLFALFTILTFVFAVIGLGGRQAVNYLAQQKQDAGIPASQTIGRWQNAKVKEKIYFAIAVLFFFGAGSLGILTDKYTFPGLTDRSPLLKAVLNFNPMGVGQSNENIAYLLTGALFILPLLAWIPKRKEWPFWKALLLALAMSGLFLFEYLRRLKN